jgi:hypothetical protein
VDIVSARVHDADFLVEIRSLDDRLEGERRVLGDGERVHVGAHRHDRARPAPTEQRHHAGVGHAGLHLESQLFQMLRHQSGGLELPVAQLGVLMNLVPQFDDGGGMALDLAVDGGVLRGGRKGGDGGY